MVGKKYVHKYVDRKGLTVMLATKRSASVAPEVIPLHVGDAALKREIYPGFETQGRHH